MKITAIPQLYRNLKRWRQILAVLRRYGLADWLSQHRRIPFRELFKDRGGVPLTQYSREQRVRMAITELGPTFIKLGQVLAARPDLVGPKLGHELKGLRSNVRADKIDTVRATLASELGEDYSSHFQNIDPNPLATASIGQVHRAVLKDGRKVVLKVQRAGIEKIIQQDVEVLGGLAQLAERVEAFAAWGPAEMVSQLAPMITRELDFGRERQNLEHFASMFGDNTETVVIPRPVNELCTRRVLVMEELQGQSIAEYLAESSTYQTPASHNGSTRNGDQNGSPKRTQADSKSTAPDSNSDSNSDNNIVPSAEGFQSKQPGASRVDTKRELCETIANTYLTMLFQHGLFHADPHTGNLFVLDNGRLGILDFGMTGRIDETLRETIEEMLVAIASGDQNRLTRLIRHVGNCPPTLDESALAIDVADFVGTFGRQNLGDFDLTGALNELTDILHRHAIKLPNQSALLLKTLISLEGTLRELGASFDSLKIVHQFVRKSMVRRMSPKRRMRQARRIYLEAENFLEAAPEQMISLMQQTRRGELRLMLEHQRLGPTVNRLVLGLITSAVFLGSSVMLATKVPPLMFRDEAVMGMEDLSLLGISGIVASVTVMMWLVLAINRSGHLTRDNDD